MHRRTGSISQPFGLVTRFVAGLVLGVVTAGAGTMSGYLRDPNWYARYQSNAPGVGYYEYAINANAAGVSTAGGAAVTDVFGRFTLSSLPAGSHTVASWDVWWRSAYAFNVQVPASGGALPVDLRLQATMWGYPAFWDDTGYHEFGQTFEASGPVTMIYLRAPYATSYTLTVHQDGPQGAQVGRSRAFNGSGDFRLVYGHGEMPTLAGRTYYARIRTSSTAVGGVLMQMDPRPDFSDPMPGGCLWLGNGSRQVSYPDRDLGLVIMSDDNGLLTDLFVRSSGSPIDGASVGQSFTARGTGLISAAFWLADPSAPTYVVRVYADGPGGQRVGTEKRGRPARVTADPEMLVLWAPGECPLVPGRSYYLEVTREGGGSFGQTYVNTSNPYAGGQAYRDGSALGSTDLAGTIVEEEAPGSAARPAVRLLSGPTIPEGLRDPRGFIVQWTTDVAADSRLELAVDHPPYTLTQYDPTPVTAHSLAVTGLLAHRLYHLRASSHASDFRPAISRDVTMVTRPATSNLLANPGFELGNGAGPARPLTSWTATSGVDVKQADGGWFWGLKPRTGGWMLQGAVNGTASDGTVHQRVTGITPGAEYTFSAWVQTAMRENDTWKYDVWQDRRRLIHLRIGIDPYGGVNPASPNIRWTPRLYSHLHYTPVAVTATAQATAITIFIGLKGEGGQWHLYAVDDCALTPADVPLDFVSPSWTLDGFQAFLRGPPHRTISVEISTNLLDWEGLTNVLNPTGTAVLTDGSDPGKAARFYRARALP